MNLSNPQNPFSHFHPIVARWFSETLGHPTSAQQRGWAAIRARKHTLIAAPTGSGKTLAAFLTAIDDLVQEATQSPDVPLPDEVRVVYVSPLKALSADIHKNLAEPRRGIQQIAHELGIAAPRITAAVRTGDTPQAERAAMLRTPPHILVTTPESLYLLLTAERSRNMLRTVRTVIVDEIHAVIGTRRGAHLALSLERLQQVAEAPLIRLGLSATQKPIEEVAKFLVGNRATEAREIRLTTFAKATAVRKPDPTSDSTRKDGAPRDIEVVDEGHRREMDLGLEIPSSSLEAVMSHEIWEEYYERLTTLIAQHRTTLIFVNTRRLAERIARHLSERLGDEAVTAHHGSLSKERRLDAESRLKNGSLKALVATASLELGIDIGHVDLVCQIGSPHRIATFLQRVGRSGHTISGTPKGRLFPISRDDLVECAALMRSVQHGELDAIVHHDAPLDVLAQQVAAETSCSDYTEDDLFGVVRRAWPYRQLERRDFDAVIQMTADGFATKRGRRAALIHRDEVNHRLRGRRGTRLLALTSGGAIPEVADYRVVVEPDDTFIGTINEDFAIESMSGDIFQLGNASWRVLQVGPGVVRVADAKGAPPNIPFWLGEAPGRSDELSRAVSNLRHDIDQLRGETATGTDDGARSIEWVMSETGIQRDAAEQVVAYLDAGRRALGAMPTQDTIILERFFDESGGMQLVLHAPFGSRINKAWGLALRKRFCRQFNFELQAAATEEALLLSLGPQHSFPLSDVFRYLHPATARDVLVQAFLDAPVFQTRWRWNTTISLAVPRYRGGKKVPPQLQRMLADDLMAAVFPDAAACLENIPGDRDIPDHPLVNQTVRDCLTEAMDFEALAQLLDRIHRNDIRCVSIDTPEPSPFSHEILNARPYAFLDDAPLEERRTQAVYARRATERSSTEDRELGALDQTAIDRVRDEQRIDPRDADELHDALLTAGFLTDEEARELPHGLLADLVAANRATHAHLDAYVGSGFSRIGRSGPAEAGPHESTTDPTVAMWVAAERLPEFVAVHSQATFSTAISAPASRTAKTWSRDEAIVELLRGRFTIVGPTVASALANACGVPEADVEAALLTLEAEGVILRGQFELTIPMSISTSMSTSMLPGRQWCDRRLLARIHRYTLNRLRAEIEPVTVAEFQRFLFAWQHVKPASKLTGLDGLRTILAQLDGFELPASAWERTVLPARLDRYEPGMLDTLCLTGEIGWAGLRMPAADAPASPRQPVAATPIALFLREHADAWQAMRRDEHVDFDPPTARVLEMLKLRGASFFRDLATACELDEADLRHALARLVGAGRVTSDGFAGLRAIVKGKDATVNSAGRWSLIERAEGGNDSHTHAAAVETQAWALLRRYGVVFRRLLTRESNTASWRELTKVFRWLEARGEIRGGRFVTGVSGEQFALPDAVQTIRETRRTDAPPTIIAISAADPLNLVGILDAGERVRATTSTRIAYRGGIAVAVMEGDYIRSLVDIDASAATEVASALAGRRVPPVLRGYVGRAG